MSGWPVEQCEKCDANGVGYNDDGDYLCEDCMFDWFCEETNAADFPGQEV